MTEGLPVAKAALRTHRVISMMPLRRSSPSLALLSLAVGLATVTLARSQSPHSLFDGRPSRLPPVRVSAPASPNIATRGVPPAPHVASRVERVEGVARNEAPAQPDPADKPAIPERAHPPTKPVAVIEQTFAEELHAAADVFGPTIENDIVSELEKSHPANRDTDSRRWLAPYTERVDAGNSLSSMANSDDPTTPFRAPDRPWWSEEVLKPLSRGGASLPLRIDEVIDQALRHSSYVYVLGADPKIRRTVLVEEQAAFDWRAFLETTYKDTNDPIGNVLTTGNSDDRFRDQTWSMDGGVRRQNPLGGEMKLTQRLGSQANNSRFLFPNPQSTTRLELQYTQPLLDGFGRAFNQSRIVLAQINAETGSDEMVAELQSHLVSVTEAYWELYRGRAEYLQRTKLLKSAQETLAMLEGREKVDAVRRQVLRARAAVATRQSEMVRAQTSIRNAESQLRLLVNDPAMVHSATREFMPLDTPLMAPLPLDMGDALHVALMHQPGISAAIREIRASAVRLGIAENQILPRLDFIVGTYVAGLDADRDVGQSFGNQFDQGAPGYNAGFLFEVPLGNRAATAQLERRRLELNRAMGRFRLSVEESLTRVEIAVREVDTSYREMAGKYEAMIAVQTEADYLEDRWRLLAGSQDSAVLLLENLLDAQERVAQEEAAMVRSQINYAMSIVRLKREMGTLLRCASQAGQTQQDPRAILQPSLLPESTDESMEDGAISHETSRRPRTQR